MTPEYIFSAAVLCFLVVLGYVIAGGLLIGRIQYERNIRSVNDELMGHLSSANADPASMDMIREFLDGSRPDFDPRHRWSYIATYFIVNSVIFFSVYQVLSNGSK